MKKFSKRVYTIAATVLMLSILFAVAALAHNGPFGGGNNYYTSLSGSTASTTTGFAGGYGGHAYVSVIVYFYMPGDPLTTSYGSGQLTQSASAGGVTASVTVSASNPACTVRYAASSIHSGSASGLGNHFTYTVSDGY
ncbi:MAG: hypothetical protein FWH17_09195 [Oscillospiraceae bacterium]|nr:hypothetical protein [Oscillospiraceae bacterium]